MAANRSRWNWLWVVLLAAAVAGCGRRPEPGPDAGSASGAAAGKAPGTDFTAEPASAASPDRVPDAASTAAPATAPAASAASADLRDRLQALVPASCRIDTADAQGEMVKLTGSADSNATIAAAMRAIERAAADLEPGRTPGAELILLERKPDGRYRFEMSVRSARLAAR